MGVLVPLRTRLRNLARRLLDRTPIDYRDLPAGADHYRAFVGPPRQYDLIGAEQFRLLTSLGLREQHSVLDFGCGSLRAGRLLIPYLDAGHYYGIEPNRRLIEDAFRFELGEDIRRLKRPEFSYNSDFRILFKGRKFDYILAQSILTHTGLDISALVLQEIARALAPDGMAVINFWKIDYVETDCDKTGWVYPACVGYTGETIRDLIEHAGLQAHRLNWYSPRTTWFLLNRPGECCLADRQLQLLRGTVLLEPDYATSLVPIEGAVIAINGKEHFVAGSAYPIAPAELGFVDCVEQSPTMPTISGWALEPSTKKPALYTVAVDQGEALKIVAYTALERSDVSSQVNLTGTVLAGFHAVYSRRPGSEVANLRVLAVFQSGIAVELPGVRKTGSAQESDNLPERLASQRRVHG